MELSSLIGRELFTPSGDKLGYSKNAFLKRDRKSVSCLVCVDEEEEEFILPARAILAAEDVIICSKARLKEPTGIPCPIGIPAYSESGKLMGIVGDLLLVENGPVYIIVKDGVITSYPAERVFPGKTLIVYEENEGGHAPRKRTVKPKTEAAKADMPPAQEQTRLPAIIPKERELTQSPAFDRCNLLDRTVRENLYGGAGILIAKKGERITPALIAAARRHNLLLRLTANTLMNN